MLISISQGQQLSDPAPQAGALESPTSRSRGMARGSRSWAALGLHPELPRDCTPSSPSPKPLGYPRLVGIHPRRRHPRQGRDPTLTHQPGRGLAPSLLLPDPAQSRRRTDKCWLRGKQSHTVLEAGWQTEQGLCGTAGPVRCGFSAGCPVSVKPRSHGAGPCRSRAPGEPRQPGAGGFTMTQGWFA